MGFPGLSFRGNPLEIINVYGRDVPHLFIYESNRVEMVTGISPAEDIEYLMSPGADKEGCEEQETRRRGLKERLFNLFRSKGKNNISHGGVAD